MISSTKTPPANENPELLGERPGIDFAFNVLANNPNYKIFEADKTNYVAHIDETLLNANKEFFRGLEKQQIDNDKKNHKHFCIDKGLWIYTAAKLNAQHEYVPNYSILSRLTKFPYQIWTDHRFKCLYVYCTSRYCMHKV